MISVAIADDQILVREGIAMLVASQPDLEVVALAADGRALLKEAARVHPDVVLMDIRMPELDGIAATERLLQSDSPPRVLVLTTFDLDEHILGAVRAGASGFLLKDAPPETLLDAIRSVEKGDAVISPSMTRRLIEHARPLLQQQRAVGNRRDRCEALSSLTSREREVFTLIARARSNAEIAAALGLSEATIKSHVAHVLQKLEVRDRVQAVVIAYESGFMDNRDVSRVVFK